MNDPEKARVSPRIARRQLVQAGAIAGLAAAMSIEIDGRRLSAAEAHRQGVPPQVLTSDQADTLGVLGESLLPGAREAGVVEFIDHQLTKPMPLLMVRYLDWPGPLTDFYTGGIVALDTASMYQFGSPFAAATPEQRALLVGTMLGGEVEGWEGPPPPLVYLAVRSDAVDVVYGTVEGFDRLGIPYMPHIEPQERW